jgi:hypothetical protein
MFAGTLALSVTAAEETSVPAVAPRVLAPVAGLAPPAVPLYSALLIAVALVKEVVPRRSSAVAPETVAETLDLVE